MDKKRHLLRQWLEDTVSRCSATASQIEFNDSDSDDQASGPIQVDATYSGAAIPERCNIDELRTRLDADGGAIVKDTMTFKGVRDGLEFAVVLHGKLRA